MKLPTKPPQPVFISLTLSVHHEGWSLPAFVTIPRNILPSQLEGIPIIAKSLMNAVVEELAKKPKSERHYDQGK